MLKRLKEFIFDSKKELIFVIIFSVLSTIIITINPYIYGLILNNMLIIDYKKVIIFVIILGLIHLIYTILNVFVSKNYLIFRKKLVLNIRKKVYKKILNINLNEINGTPSGVIINKTKDDTTRISITLSSIKDCIFISLGNIVTVFIIFYLNYIIGIYYFICIFILLSVRYYGIKKSIYYKSLNLEYLDYNATLLNQTIKGAHDIKLLKLKNNFIDKSEDSFENIGNTEYKSNSYIEYTDKIARLLEAIFQGIMIIISIILIQNKLLDISVFVSIFMYRNSIFLFTSRLSVLINNIRMFNLSFERILSILDYESETFGNLNLKKYDGNIKFKNVSFKYNNKTILDNINLDIKKNSFVCIIGDNGVGKTTLISLISKINSPTTGNIYLDSYDINDLSEEAIRNNISYLTQNPFLFNMSIKENLSIIDSDFKNIKKICKEVGIDKKIESLENGYDTILLEESNNLSGGEKKRLSIARALLSNSKVILLDEITNNLDLKSKNDIINILKKLKGKYTIVLVTHDLDIMRLSDKIIEIKNGKIIEK